MDPRFPSHGNSISRHNTSVNTELPLPDPTWPPISAAVLHSYSRLFWGYPSSSLIKRSFEASGLIIIGEELSL